MLVLGRKVGESIQMSGQIKVTVVMISGNRVKVGIEAPDDVRIVRSELDDWSELSFDFPESLETEANDNHLAPDGQISCSLDIPKNPKVGLPRRTQRRRLLDGMNKMNRIPKSFP